MAGLSVKSGPGGSPRERGGGVAGREGERRCSATSTCLLRRSRERRRRTRSSRTPWMSSCLCSRRRSFCGQLRWVLVQRRPSARALVRRSAHVVFQAASEPEWPQRPLQPTGVLLLRRARSPCASHRGGHSGGPTTNGLTSRSSTRRRSRRDGRDERSSRTLQPHRSRRHPS